MTHLRQQYAKTQGKAAQWLLFILLLSSASALWFSQNLNSFPPISLSLPGLPIIRLFSPPCSEPRPYAIGDFDKRFNISEATFKESVASAAARWTKAVGKKLFVENAGNGMRINLVYDERQQETEMMAELGLSIEQSRDSFEKTKAVYDTLKEEYAAASQEYDAAVASFNADRQKNNDQIAYWNSRGGAPKQAYAQIETETAALATRAAELNTMRLAINAKADTLNRLASFLNQLSGELNLNITKYNTGGADIRKEFTAGVYEQDANGKSINIYEFENAGRLVDVLTHEFGHALGLEHNDNPNSVMYRLNEGQNQKIIQSDVAALLAKCPALK